MLDQPIKIDHDDAPFGCIAVSAPDIGGCCEGCCNHDRDCSGASFWTAECPGDDGDCLVEYRSDNQEVVFAERVDEL